MITPDEAFDLNDASLSQEWSDYQNSQEYTDELEVLFEMDCIEDNGILPDN